MGWGEEGRGAGKNAKDKTKKTRAPKISDRSSLGLRKAETQKQKRPPAPRVLLFPPICKKGKRNRDFCDSLKIQNSLWAEAWKTIVLNIEK